MRYLILLMIAFEAQLLFADNRIDLVQLARQIENFMALETRYLKLLTESSIADVKQKLNEAVDILEQLIKQGPEKCHNYLTDFYKIRMFYTNFRHSFYDCKLYLSMDINRKTFSKLLKEFDDWKNKWYEPMDEETGSKFEMFIKRIKNFLADFTDEMSSKKLGMYRCLKQLKYLKCGLIMDVGNSWSNKCTNNGNLTNYELDIKCML